MLSSFTLGPRRAREGWTLHPIVIELEIEKQSNRRAYTCLPLGDVLAGIRYYT